MIRKAALSVLLAVFAEAVPGQSPPPAAPRQALFESGVASLKAARYQDAEEAFRNLAALEPAGLRALLGLTQVLILQKKPVEAIRLLQAETTKSPSRPELHLVLGDTFVRLGQYDGAIVEFKAALAL